MKKPSGGKAAVNPFMALTWTDLEKWSGARILSRGKTYQRSGQVEGLGITPQNDLVAWVQGSVRYATQVRCREGELSSACTCPYGTSCKHAVAVVIDYLQAVKAGKTIPQVADNDKRLKMIEEGKIVWSEDSEQGWEDELEEEQEASDARRPDNLGAYLKGKSKAELSKIVLEIVKNHPEIELELLSNPGISRPSVARLAQMLSREIDQVSRESAWSNHWSRDEQIPDYSGVRNGLQTLFETGHFDEIIHLGNKLFNKGIAQINESTDQGETVDEISQTLEIVYKALKQSSLTNIEKMEQAINWELADEFDLTASLASFWKTPFDAKEWSAVADRLLKQLGDIPPAKEKEDFHYCYTRDKLTGQIIRALEKAGRSEEILALCIQEAPLTHSYPRLVRLLRKLGKDGRAEEWILKGIRATRDHSAGIAADLVQHMLEIRKAQKDWPFCAAIVAAGFFESHNMETYTELKHYCEKIGEWERVRQKLLLFLNTGTRPSGEEWPLPHPGIEQGRNWPGLRPPFTGTLIKIALLEKDLEEALRLYDEDMRKQKKTSPCNFSAAWGLREQIAEAVKNKYPDRSIAIWKDIAKNHIERTLPKEYAVALGYLKKIQGVMVKNGRESEFKAYIALLKAQHIRKIRLVELLDSLLGRRIVDG
ncbi:MAG TPA: SWIM zinc finger family protein [bacterium]|nr:SWIM zinc finger family protein [bacterium]